MPLEAERASVYAVLQSLVLSRTARSRLSPLPPLPPPDC